MSDWIFRCEPIVQLCELVFALVDDALFQALRVCNHGGREATRARLGRCLDTLQNLEGAALDELAGELQPYVTQFELTFLSLVRLAFTHHCAAHSLPEDETDVALTDDDLDKMPGGFLRDVFMRVCATPVVRDMRYFEQTPLEKSVMIGQQQRAAFHALVPRHARFFRIKKDAAASQAPSPAPSPAPLAAPTESPTPIRRMTPVTPALFLGPTPHIEPHDSISVVMAAADPPSFRDCVPGAPELPKYDGTQPLVHVHVLPTPRPTPRLQESLVSAARSPEDAPESLFSAGPAGPAPAWRAGTPVR